MWSVGIIENGRQVFWKDLGAGFFLVAWEMRKEVSRECCSFIYLDGSGVSETLVVCGRALGFGCGRHFQFFKHSHVLRAKFFDKPLKGLLCVRSQRQDDPSVARTRDEVLEAHGLAEQDRGPSA